MKYLAAALFIAFSTLFLYSCEDKAVPTPSQIKSPAKATSAAILTISWWDTANYKIQSVTYADRILSINGLDSMRGTGNQFTMSLKATNPGTYTLSYSNTAYLSWIYYNSMAFPPWCATDSTHTGIVDLTTLDTINHLASGTFRFKGLYHCANYPDTVANVSGSFSNLTW
jgi:hypothetical protein